MFAFSGLLTVQALLANIFVPIIPGLLFIWLLFGAKWKGLLLWVLAWLLGVGVVGHGLFAMQFVVFGVGIWSYVILCLLLVGGLSFRIYKKKESLHDYLISLKGSSGALNTIYKQFLSLPRGQKIATVLLLVYVIVAVANMLVANASFPTYWYDSFTNWHRPVLNILHDGGVHVFGEVDEIMGRGREGYPIMVAIYKAVISDFTGGYNDIYITLYQFLVFLALILMTMLFTYSKTKNIVYSLLPSALICSLPMIYFHVIDGYLEVASIVYSFMIIWSFFMFFDTKDHAYPLLSICFIAITSYIKNDGFVVYAPAMILTLLLVVALYKDARKQFLAFWKEKSRVITFAILLVIFYVLPLIPRIVYKQGFNHAALAADTGLTTSVHWEIFEVFPTLFLSMNNYNVILIFVVLSIAALWVRKIFKSPTKMLVWSAPFVLFLVLTLVFLLTENYKWVLDYTTVNRVYSMVFVLLFAFIGYLFAPGKK